MTEEAVMVEVSYGENVDDMFRRAAAYVDEVASCGSTETWPSPTATHSSVRSLDFQPNGQFAT